MENKIFSISGEKGYAPMIVESDWKTYRVEQFYGTGPLKYNEMWNDEVVSMTAPLICHFNYDAALHEAGGNALKMDEFVHDRKDGWYWKAKEELWPMIESFKENPNFSRF